MAKKNIGIMHTPKKGESKEAFKARVKAALTKSGALKPDGKVDFSGKRERPEKD